MRLALVNATRMLVALVVVSAVSWLLHRYLWARLIRDALWPEPWGRGLTVAVFVLAALVPLSFLAMRWMPRSANAPVAWIAYTWLGFAFYLFVLLVAVDAFR